MDYQRILIILGLAVTAYLLILAWNEDYGKNNSANTQPAQVVEQQSGEGQIPFTETSSGAGVDALGTDTVPSVALIPESEPSTIVQEQKVGVSRRISVFTDVHELKIDLLGGDIVSGALPRYPATLETPDIPFLLLDPANSYAAQSGLIGQNGTDTAKGRPLFSTLANTYKLNDNSTELVVELLYQQDRVSVTKRFIFTRGDYLIRIEYLINNQSDEAWRAALFAQIKRDGNDPSISDAAGMGLQPYVGGATFKPGEPYSKLHFDDIEDETYRLKVDGGYIALVQHYFVSAWVPSDEKAYTYQARKLNGQDIYLFGFTGPITTVNAGSSGIIGASYYLGPKDQYRLKEISEGLNLTVDYGFLWWLAQPLFDLLQIIHGFVNNYGAAIIILTIIVKTLLYPLSAASFRSMAKMRKLQPEMARLKERFGDDRQQFSQAMMEMYKKEGANPLGGCLPILLQMPVFLALYWTLMESVELRQAPFILWIDDLSAMDPYFVLPILMGASMFVTQMLQPELPDPVQAKVMKFMPIMFTFFFLWFPSGLVLYWLVNNLLSILQQWYVTRQIQKAT